LKKQELSFNNQPLTGRYYHSFAINHLGFFEDFFNLG